MIRERGEPAIADTSKPILEAPVVPDFPSNPTVPQESVEDPDVLAAMTDHPSPYNDNVEIIDTGDDEDSEIMNRNGVVVGDDKDEDLLDDDDDEDDDIS